MPQPWCHGLITPIFKCGTKSDPSNYRGICISSCIGKLFCSILNQRLLKHVDLNNILHKSQIGFLANNRTADHVLTLRTLIDKYVHCHKEKIYACFVDFRKAFDSVWHDGLLYKLSKVNVQGKFYSLIKSLYSKATCSVRIENNKMRSFQYVRGVRKGCKVLCYVTYASRIYRSHLTMFCQTLSCYQMTPDSTLSFTQMT